jgi:poly-gamma-glutamate capsule biosynthesis protein CapA/YwtB (metallophosphatase superfamily)
MLWDWSLSTLFTSASEVWETQMGGQGRSSSRRLMAKATRTTTRTTTRKGQACIPHRQDYKPENCKTTITASAMKLLKMEKLQQHENIQCDCAKTDETPAADKMGPSIKTSTHREQKEEENLLKLSHCCC